MRFALIDIDSGYVWDVVEANDPIGACKTADEDEHQYGRSYEMHGAESGAERNGQAGYIVYQGGPELTVSDGQDPDQIAAVKLLPKVAIVLFTDIREADLA